MRAAVLEIMSLAAYPIVKKLILVEFISGLSRLENVFKEIEMGVFSVTIGVGHPGGDLTELSAIVDTGAYHTMLPKSLLA